MPAKFVGMEQSEAYDEAQDERINPMVGLFDAAVRVVHVSDMEIEPV